MLNNVLKLLVCALALVSCGSRACEKSSCNPIVTQDSSVVKISGCVPVEGEWDSKWIHRYAEDVDALALKASQDGRVDVDVVFFGSSSIRLWKDLEEMMAPLSVVNRGYGGATVRDILVNYDKIMAQYSPKAFVVFCDNDICGNVGLDLSVSGVLDHYRMLFGMLERDYPGVPVYFLSWKYSGLRASLRSTQKLVNDIMSDFAGHSSHVTFVDVNSTLLLPDGDVDKTLFEADDLHINRDGYLLWTSVLKPHLLEVCK